MTEGKRREDGVWEGGGTEWLHTEMAHPNICGSLSAAGRLSQSSTNHSLTANSFFSISVLYKSHSCRQRWRDGVRQTSGSRRSLFYFNLCYNFGNEAFNVCKNKALISSLLLFPCPPCCSVYRQLYMCWFQNKPIREEQRRSGNQSSERSCMSSLNLVAANKCCSESGRVMKSLRQ